VHDLSLSEALYQRSFKELQVDAGIDHLTDYGSPAPSVSAENPELQHQGSTYLF